MLRLAFVLLAAVTSAVVVADFPAPEVRSIRVFTGSWLLTFYPPGNAEAQYGSLLGDSGAVPEGTVDFDEFLRHVQQADEKPHERCDVELSFGSESEWTTFVPADDTFVWDLLSRIDTRWRPSIVAGRFDELRMSHPISQKLSPPDC